MDNLKFEMMFDNYLNSRKADKVFDEYFHQIRAAFRAGFLCGYGEIIEPDKNIQIYKSDDIT